MIRYGMLLSIMLLLTVRAAENSNPEADKPVIEIDPTIVSGTPPKTPLELPSLASIEDKMENQSASMQIELGAMGDILMALRSCSQEHLNKNVDVAVTYKELMMRPEKHRGKVGKLTGVLRGLYECTFKKNASGLSKYWKGVFFDKGKAQAFISIEKPPDNVKLGCSIEATGFFFKRYGYLNDEPGEKVSLVPLLFIRRPVRIEDINDGIEVLDDLESKFKLPRAGANDWQLDIKFRLTVQLVKGADGKYYGIVDGHEYCLLVDKERTTLVQFLEPFIKEADEAGFKPDEETGGYHIPVKLRIPSDAPMREAERLIQAMAQLKLVSVQYVAAGDRRQPPLPPRKARPPARNPAQETNPINIHVIGDGEKVTYRFKEIIATAEEFGQKLMEAVDKDPSISAARVSYEPDAQWGDVMYVFNACTCAWITECGLIPLRGDKLGR